MALPSSNDVHAVDVPLSNLSVAFMAENPSIADIVFPKIEVRKQSDKYYVYDRGDFNRVSVMPRAPYTESEGADWRLSTDAYYADPYALHKDVSFEERANQDDALDLDQDAVAFLSHQMKLKKDKVWAAEYFTTSVWTGGTSADPTPGTKWNAANSTPIEDIRAQIRSITTKSGGYRPNTLVLGGDAWDALQDNSQFLDRIKHTQKGIVTKDLVAQVLELDRVLVGETVENTAIEGATTSMSAMFSDAALLLYVAPRPGKRVPSAGYQFRWVVPGATSTTVKRMPMDLRNAERFEIQEYWDNKVVSSIMGCFFTNVLT